MLVTVRASVLATNLILHHSIADVLNHAAKLLHILRVAEESYDLALLCQRREVLENFIQFAGKG